MRALSRAFLAVVPFAVLAATFSVTEILQSQNARVNSTYDYIIIGGGTAGLTIAARLAQNPRITVAVIEAGGFYEQDNGNNSVVPAYCVVGAGTDPSQSKATPLVDWGFVTTAQAGANNRKLHYARGKTLGGSSARNFMLYHRQTIGSAKKWAEEVGDMSYTFENMLPYYEKSVHYHSPSENNLSFANSSNSQDPQTLRRTGGPLRVSFGGYVDPFGARIQPALEYIGQRAIDGFQSGRLIGSAYVPSTIDPKHATRSSSETSFLQSVKNSTNLHVYKNALAEKILFNDNNTATCVLVSPTGPNSTNGTNGSISFVINANRETIVSAGVFQSPQLLMVSGIGPKAQLEPLGIPIVKHLPGVGQNMWDHAFYGTEYRVNVNTASAGLNNPALAVAALDAYKTQAKGPLSISATGFLGWEKLPGRYRSALTPAAQRAYDVTFPEDWPELEFLPGSGPIRNLSNFLIEDPVDGYNYAAITTALVAPLSRGNITLTSAKMVDAPLINPNWITDPSDIELAIAAFKRQREAWQAMNETTVGEESYPGPKVQSDSQILEFIRANLAPVWHASSTCKMGVASDPMAVVDAKAKVIGVQGLRVVDASAFPFLPPGHPQATVYALAEKIAAEILGEGHVSWR